MPRHIGTGGNRRYRAALNSQQPIGRRGVIGQTTWCSMPNLATDIYRRSESTRHRVHSLRCERVRPWSVFRTRCASNRCRTNTRGRELGVTEFVSQALPSEVLLKVAKPVMAECFIHVVNQCSIHRRINSLCTDIHSPGH